MSSPLSAQVDAEAPESASSLMREALRAEREAEPERALERYRTLEAAHPTSRLASRARRRIEWLEARAEGDYAPLAVSMRFGALPLEARGPSVVADFEARTRTFPPGRVRREAWPLVGESWLELGEAARAEAAFGAWLEEPDLAPNDRLHAEVGIARARALAEGPRAGAAHLASVGLEETDTHRVLAREASRRVGRWVAAALIAAFALFALALTGRRAIALATWRRALSPARLAIGLYALVGPFAIATLYDHDAHDTFGLLAVASGGLFALASMAGVALEAKRAGLALRLPLAGLAVLAHLGLGYLALDWADQLVAFS